MGRPKGSTKRLPDYCCHKPSNRAYVRLNGVVVYLDGKYDSAESHTHYDRVIGEWIARGRQSVNVKTAGDGTVAELLAGYMEYARVFYNGGNALDRMKPGLRILHRYYGVLAVGDFDQLKLIALRERMILEKVKHTAKTWTRQYVNAQIKYLKGVFCWGVERKLVPSDLYHGLLVVRQLQRGKTNAREGRKVKPVPQELLDATLPLLGPTVRAMADLQLLTGMRPGEVCIMRTCDIDTTPTSTDQRARCRQCEPGRPCRRHTCWIYQPSRHKTEHLDIIRQVPIGPKAQEIIARFLTPDLQAFLFTPANAWREYCERRLAGAKTYRTPEDRERNLGWMRKWQAKAGRKTKERKFRQRYTATTYRSAIYAACRRADALAHKAAPSIPADSPIIERWHPHRLRHNAATVFRAEFGIEAARAILGHQSAKMTEVYAEQDIGCAMDVMGAVG